MVGNQIVFYSLFVELPDVDRKHCYHELRAARRQQRLYFIVRIASKGIQ